MHALEPRPLGLQRPCRFVRKGRDQAPCAPARTATASGHAEGAGRNAAARTRPSDAGSFHNRLRNGRLPSEALLIRMGDPALAGDFRFTQEDPDRPVPTIVLFTTDGTVALHLSRRKHMPRPSVVRRACWCSTCKATCPVHAPRSLLCGVVPGAFPFAHLARPTAAGRVLPSPAVTRNLRRSAEAAGLPNAARITTRCLRRGHTETLRQSGGNLAAILRAGDWRSGAFKAYLDQPALEAAASGEGMALPAGADPRVAGHDPASAASQP